MTGRRRQEEARLRKTANAFKIAALPPRKPGAHVIPAWICSVCEMTYKNEDDALRCAAKPWAPAFEVGDIVIDGIGRYGWCNGIGAWVASRPKDNKKHGMHGDGYGFYYVVTLVDADDRDSHRPRYHLHTMAMSEISSYSNGYTFDTGHVTVEVVPRERVPEIVLEGAANLIGKRSEKLL